jgi:hypothetical protein
MLGIRHYRGCAVDLWCGDPNEFVADRHRSHCYELAALAGQHLAIAIGDSEMPDVIFARLLAELLVDPIPRRVTLILPSLARYKEFQAALFEKIPELTHE